MIISGRNSEPEKSKLLASAISSRMTAINIEMSLVQRGLVVVNESGRPAVAIECGDIGDRKNIEMLTNDKKLESFCRHILSGIADYQNNR